MLAALEYVCDRTVPHTPLMLLPRADQVRAYLIDIATAKRCPSVVVLRTDRHMASDPGLELVAWIRVQPEPLKSVWIIAITNEFDGGLNGDSRVLVTRDVTEDGLGSLLALVLSRADPSARLIT